MCFISYNSFQITRTDTPPPVSHPPGFRPTNPNIVMIPWRPASAGKEPRDTYRVATATRPNVPRHPASGSGVAPPNNAHNQTGRAFRIRRAPRSIPRITGGGHFTKQKRMHPAHAETRGQWRHIVSRVSSAADRGTTAAAASLGHVNQIRHATANVHCHSIRVAL